MKKSMSLSVGKAKDNRRNHHAKDERDDEYRRRRQEPSAKYAEILGIYYGCGGMTPRR